MPTHKKEDKMAKQAAKKESSSTPVSAPKKTAHKANVQVNIKAEDQKAIYFRNLLSKANTCKFDGNIKKHTLQVNKKKI